MVHCYFIPAFCGRYIRVPTLEEKYMKFDAHDLLLFRSLKTEVLNAS